jgi:hypothetical protein
LLFVQPQPETLVRELEIKVPNTKLAEVRAYLHSLGAEISHVRPFYERRGVKRRSRAKHPMLFSVLKLCCAARIQIPRSCRALPKKKLSISSTPKRR